jgi:hypothetical protein
MWGGTYIVKRLPTTQRRNDQLRIFTSSPRLPPNHSFFYPSVASRLLFSIPTSERHRSRLSRPPTAVSSPAFACLGRILPSPAGHCSTAAAKLLGAVWLGELGQHSPAGIRARSSACPERQARARINLATSSLDAQPLQPPAMDGYVTETESDYVSYWRDWVRTTPPILFVVGCPC